MIDTNFHAKLLTELKHSVNIASLENAKYNVTVTEWELELELKGLEEGDDIPVPAMTTTPTISRPGSGLLSFGIDTNTT